MRDKKLYTILNGVTATTTGNVVLVDDFRHCILSFSTSGNANLTLKIQGSIQDTAPTFSAAQSPTNQWDYIEVVDLQSGSAIDGDTGIALTGTDDHRLFEVNINALKWICATASPFTTGILYVKAMIAEGK